MNKTEMTLQLLRDYESRNVTFMEPDGSWPIVWQRAQGVHVWDADGKKYLDLTAAFGVAAAGHANPNVVKAGCAQMKSLLHAMGDVHPHSLKAELARELSRITFERWASDHQKSKIKNQNSGKTIFCNSGFEAVEAALKTAFLATNKSGVIAFQGAYHGLGYGALNVTHRDHFRSPFRRQLREFAHFVPFPAGDEVTSLKLRGAKFETPHVVSYEEVERRLRALLRTRKIGAVLVEPIQGRGGINIPPKTFLRLLRKLCDEFKAILIHDEILTGFGRTGKWFACEHAVAPPDIICLGKALTGGFPLSACVGRADIMDAAWPSSTGEAIHTSTFLGHPVGCAMALAQIEEIRRNNLVERSVKLGGFLLRELNKEFSKYAPHLGSLPTPASRGEEETNSAFGQFSNFGKMRIALRGVGLMAGVELRLPNGSPATTESLSAIKTLLHRGFIFLPEGEHTNVISFTPPFTISERQLKEAVGELFKVLKKIDIALPGKT